MKQHRMTTPGPLLNERGELAEKGYATGLIKRYDRGAVRASPLRIKEWDYYLIASDAYALALTIADNGYMGLDSVSLIDLGERWEQTTSRMSLLPLGRRGLPCTSERGCVRAHGKGYEITFETSAQSRRLYGHMDNFKDAAPVLFDVTLTDAPRDSMVIATPFPGAPRAFYYNQKINCLRAEGKMVWNSREYLFAPAHSFAVLDWGRGVWTYRNTWYWGSASGLVNGEPFGFNIGYGFGDTAAATENMLFYRGEAHKLSHVRFHIPSGGDGREDYLSPWRFDSDDGRFEMNFTPILDRAACTDFKLLCSDQHQVFGRFNGVVRLDDGTPLTVRGLTGFAEKVFNKW